MDDPTDLDDVVVDTVISGDEVRERLAVAYLDSELAVALLIHAVGPAGKENAVRRASRAFRSENQARLGGGGVQAHEPHQRGDKSCRAESSQHPCCSRVPHCPATAAL